MLGRRDHCGPATGDKASYDDELVDELPREIRNYDDTATISQAGILHDCRDSAALQDFPAARSVVDAPEPYACPGQDGTAACIWFWCTFMFMRDLKDGPHEDSYKRFAKKEQRAESDFVYGCVVRRIFDEKPDVPIWTIHDSILTVPAYQRYVKDLIEQEAAHLFGFIPQLEDVDYGATGES